MEGKENVYSQPTKLLCRGWKLATVVDGPAEEHLPLFIKTGRRSARQARKSNNRGIDVCDYNSDTLLETLVFSLATYYVELISPMLHHSLDVHHTNDSLDVGWCSSPHITAVIKTTYSDSYSRQSSVGQQEFRRVLLYCVLCISTTPRTILKLSSSTRLCWLQINYSWSCINPAWETRTSTSSSPSCLPSFPSYQSEIEKE